MRATGLLRGVIAIGCCIAAAPFAEAQWAASAQEPEPALPSFIDKRKLPNLNIPPAPRSAPAASESEEETRRRAEELSKKFSGPEATSGEKPAGGGTGQGSSVGAGNGQPPGGSAEPSSDQALRRELEMARQRAKQAEDRARKERADREAFEAESRKAMEQAAAAVAKAQEEAKQAARRAAEAEKRAGRVQEQKKPGVGFKPAGMAGHPTAPRVPAEQRLPLYEDRRAQGFGLGDGRPVK